MKQSDWSDADTCSIFLSYSPCFVSYFLSSLSSYFPTHISIDRFVDNQSL